MKTNQVTLRKYRAGDDKYLRDLDSDPEVMKYLTNGTPSDDKEIARANGVMLEWNNKFESKYGYWLAFENESNDFVGWFHLRPLKDYPDDIENLELGYRLKKLYWGRGIASEVSHNFIDLARSYSDCRNIWACAMAVNTGSRKVMEKVGLKFDRDDTYQPYPTEDKHCVWYKLALK